jgi:hypothetical protein
MGQQHCFHAAGKNADFLGWRLDRLGRTEIVYDDCRDTRIIWRAAFEGDAGTRLDEALASAVNVGHEKLLPTLFEELRKRSIDISKI